MFNKFINKKIQNSKYVINFLTPTNLTTFTCYFATYFRPIDELSTSFTFINKCLK
jgi:hypothetical protein